MVHALIYCILLHYKPHILVYLVVVWFSLKTNISAENRWLEDDSFLLGRPIFRAYLKLHGCISFSPSFVLP